MAERGRLVIKVCDEETELPVAGAIVVVTQRGEQGREILRGVQMSATGGETKPIVLEPVGTLLGIGPENQLAPFTLCDVWAEREGYVMEKVTDVWVFAGEDTLLCVGLAEIKKDIQEQTDDEEELLLKANTAEETEGI